jgi:hypothetical protein
MQTERQRLAKGASSLGSTIPRAGAVAKTSHASMQIPSENQHSAGGNSQLRAAPLTERTVTKLG